MNDSPIISTKWRTAVEGMWATQRLLLFSMAAVLFLAFAGLFLTILCIDSEAWFMPMIPFALVGIVALIAYVLQWYFFSNVKNWQEAAPQEDNKHIGLYKTALLIQLISAGVIIFGSFLAIIPIIGILGTMLTYIASLATTVAFIMQFIAIVKLRKSQTMPTEAKRGISSLFKYYIIYFASVAIGYTMIIVGALFFVPAIIENDGDAEEFMEDVLSINTSNPLLDGYDDGYDDYYDYDRYYYEDDYYEDDYYEDSADGVFTTMLIIGIILIIIGYAVMFIGCIVATVFYYRGWWLISKSELVIAATPNDESYAESAKIVEVQPQE